MLFDVTNYEFDREHGAFEIGGETMIFHCHHYLNYLQRSILDADYIDSRPFLIGAAADCALNQLENLTNNLSFKEKMQMCESVYKTFGYGIIDLSSLNKNGGTIATKNSFYSQTWIMKFTSSTKPVDYFTTGYIAATLSILFEIPLSNIIAKQTKCLAVGDDENEFYFEIGECNFKLYPKKLPTKFKDVQKHKIPWEHEDVITDAFIGAHAMLVGNNDGLIPAFGVYVSRNYSDYVNRLQVEFIDAMKEAAGMYGVTLGRELMMEAGYACGFFTYGGIMTSPEWEGAVKPYLKTKEDWIAGLASLINAMGWGYHTALEVSKDCSIFRNYNDFEDMSYIRMYGESSQYPVSWANAGGFAGLCQLIYQTGLTEGNPIETEEGFRQMRRNKVSYKTKMTKSIVTGDDFLEAEVYTN
jgi:predicted hydrocarbon binding protein